MKKIIFFLVLFTWLHPHAQTINNNLRFKKGEQYQIASESKTTVSQDIMGQSVDFTIKMEVLEVYEVKDVNKKEAVLFHKVKKIKMTTEGMGGGKTFDSDIPGDMNDEIAAPLKEILTKTFEISVDNTGKITGIKSEAGHQNDSLSQNMNSMLPGKLFLDLDPKINQPSVFKIFPDKAVAKGDNWSDSTITKNSKQLTSYTLKDITETDIIIDFKTTSETEANTEAMGMQTSTSTHDTASGKIILDRSTGIIRQKMAVSESSGTVSVMGQTLPIAGKTTVLATVTRQ
jgi:hypothetical protein